MEQERLLIEAAQKDPHRFAELYESTPGPSARLLGTFLMAALYQGSAVACAMFLTGQASNVLVAGLSAKLTGVSELKYWTLAYVISGVFAALTGSLLLGWSGGGFIGVGDPYLFTTLAAVVIGGTSLLGGYGGYGFTVIGVLVLQVLSSFLIGIGLKYEWQQFIFGLLILPMVALYGRSPHIRSQV